MDEETNLSQTIENDMKNRDKNKGGPVARKLRNKANKEVKKATKKARKKLKSMLFKPVCIGLLPALIIIFMLIGMISFITSMPGLVQEEMMQKVIGFVDGFKEIVYGSDFYLSKLASDSDQTAQKNVLKYLDEMGIDPVGFGFASFYLKDSDGNVEFEIPGNTINDIRTIDGVFDGVDVEWIQDLGAIGDAQKYNRELTEERLRGDLILKYIISNERTFLIHDGDKIGNKDTDIGAIDKLLGNYDLTGMIKTKIEGLDDSTITVDRENKQMVINSANFQGPFDLKKQKAKYNLETWAGRYGMPLEFLLAIHIATMSSDLTEEMLANENLQTVVDVASEKGKYSIDYEIKYDGKDLGIRRGKTDARLESWTDAYIEEYDDGTYGVDISDDKLNELKKEVSISSLYNWTNELRKAKISEEEKDYFFSATNQAKDAFLGDGAYRVLYRIVTPNFSTNNWENSAYYGIARIDQEKSNGNEIVYGFSARDLPKGDEDSNTLDGSYVNNTNDTYDEFCEKIELDTGIICFHSHESPYSSSIHGNDWRYKDEDVDYDDVCYYFFMTSEGKNWHETGILHGINYYLDGNEWEVKSMKYVRDGITCMLSQIDTFLYINNFEDLSSVEMFEGLKINDPGSGLPQYKNIPFGNGNNRSSAVYEDYSGSYYLITAEWLEFWENNPNPTNEEIHAELEYIASRVEECFNVIYNKDEIINQILYDLLSKLGIDADTLGVEEINAIYNALETNSDDFEFVLPRIKTVTRHWYKDVVFENENGKYSVYDEVEKLRFPVELDEQQNPDGLLEITAVLEPESDERAYEQVDQPWVVKGDIVTVDGKQVDDSTAEDIKNITVDGYKLGDGYRTTKKLFTQGQYYNFDGSKETSQSIWFAKRLEELKAGEYAKVVVRGGRITLLGAESATDKIQALYNKENNQWDTSGQVIHEDRKAEEICAPENAVKVAEDGSWTIYLVKATFNASTEEPTNHYYVRANTDLKYVSVTEGVDKSKESVERINSLLEAMGVVTIRKPVTFDNVTVNGDVTALTAFGLLEGMHSEAAEYIYRDLKEFLIELGYYTKAEFEYIETNVLEWFIPDYIPETDAEIANWKQNREEDALKYGAIIYPTEIGEDGKATHIGIDAGCDVIAPGNCRVVEKSDTSITIEFDGISQPEIGALDRYTMIIEGIEISSGLVEVQKQDGSSGGSKTIDELVGTTDVILAKQVIGKTGTNAVQVILKNSRGGYIDNIEDYMAPKKLTIDGNRTYFSITGTILTTQEFTNACLNYMNANGISNSDFTEDSLKEFYNICKKKGVNPELAFVTALIEGGELMYSSAVSTHNYWGYKASNGSTLQSFGTMLETLELYCDLLIDYQDPQKGFYEEIMKRYEERASCTENGGCNPNGYGEPNTMQGIQSIYSYVGNHEGGGTNAGAYYFLDPDIGGCTAIYATHEEFVRKCKNRHEEGSRSTIWEQNQYNAYQVEQKIEKAKKVFGEKAGKYMR